MPYNNVTSRTDAAALIPEEVSNAILGSLINESAVMSLGRRIPVSRAQLRMPILSALPQAYWVSGDTGLKQTTEANWANKYLNIEELAAIVVMPENVLDDVDYPLLDMLDPLLRQAAVRAFDQAVIFGTNAPASFPTALVPGAVAAGNVLANNANAAAAGGIVQTISDAMALVEQDGFDPTGMIANVSYKGKLRGARTTQGEPLLDNTNNIYGIPTRYPMRGLWPSGASAAELLLGDFANELVYGVRQDVTFKWITEGVITDTNSAIQYNLPQQDMVALRMKFRVGWQIANTINYDNPNDTTRYPFAVIRTPA